MNNIVDDLADTSILRIGDKAPDFVLNTEDGGDWRLSEQRGKITALLFYPQNETLVCNRQLCSVRDNWADYLETKAHIVGISPAAPEEHQRFSQRHRLPLTILADVDRTITKIYGRHWLFPIQLTRAIVVVDARGVIRHRRVMLRAFRPTDKSVIASIYAARADFLHERFNHLISESKERNKYAEKQSDIT